MYRNLGTLGVAALSVLFSCSGGGGGGGAKPGGGTGNTLQGNVRVPALRASVVGGGRFDLAVNDEIHSAEALGRLSNGERRVVAGRVSVETDPQDVYRLELEAPAEVCIELSSDGAVCHVFEIETGREALRLLSGERRSFVASVGSLDIVVAAAGRDADYELLVSQSPATDTATSLLPLPSFAPARESAAQARYLGAEHPMVPGEIVVFRDRSAAVPELVIADCELAKAGAGSIDVYRIRGAERFPRHADGAPLEESLELATCLTAKRIESMPGVLAASPNYRYEALATEPNDEYYRLQWHYGQINMPQAWDITKGSANVIVGVLDTGVVLGHPEFQGRLVAGYDMISDPQNALDGDGRDADPDDPGDGGGAVPSSFHGTHVAGTIGANSDNQVGVAGVDWNCKIMPIRVLGRQGGTLDDIASGILFAGGLQNASGQVPSRRVDVLNMSLGGPSAASVMEQACDAAAAAGVLLIAAAGNDNTPNPNYPASYSSVLSVGAVDFDRQRAPYSNYANNIDIWAPGGDMQVDRNGDNQPDGVLSTKASGFAGSRQATVAYENGTSMAAPHIAGVAALLLSINPNITLADLRSLLTRSGQAGSNLPNGGVLVDAAAALRAANGGGGGGGGGQQPVLVATPNAVSFGSDKSEVTVGLANQGGGNLSIDPNQSGIRFAQPGVNWLGVNANTPGTNISHSKLTLTADRSGLADGDYQATVRMAFSDGQNTLTVEVTVALQVGVRQPTAEKVFVLLVDAETSETRHEVEIDQANSYAYSLAGIPAGEYVLAAGTDRDADGMLGDAGELFGMWPNNDSPLILVVEGEGHTTTGLDFALQGITALQVGSSGRELQRL